MNRHSSREVFDNISLNVLSFLESHIGVSDVEFNEQSGKYIVVYFHLHSILRYMIHTKIYIE